jgi:hypothetical protein
VTAPAPAPVDQVESKIARDLAVKALIAAPLVAIALGVWRGPDAALAVVLAFGIVIVNFLASAALLGWCARTHPTMLAGVALFSFLGRLILITVIGIGIKELDIVDWPVFCITLVVSYFALLTWELRSVSFSLASPGLKPKPGQE